MRAVSNELRQVFRAYTKQLRGEYAKAKKGEQFRQNRAKGFERVEISDEAKALAAANQTEAKSGGEKAQKSAEREQDEKKAKEKSKGKSTQDASSSGQEQPLEEMDATDQEQQ